MRAAIAYYMMILYFTVMFKPLIPIVKDTISHTFAEAIHIATVHAIYGSNHLQKEIAESDGGNTNNKHQNNTNGEEQVQIHIVVKSCIYNFLPLATVKNYFYYKYCNLLAGYIIKFSPPPKFC